MMIKIVPSMCATRRTKSRLKQHGEEFFLQEISFPICFEGEECLLIRSIETDWVGWIPTKEVLWKHES